MATERQIAANRQNALSSTGPRSERGKGRSSGNAYQHGFRSRTGRPDSQKIDELARKIAGEGANRVRFEYARHAAEAELTLRQISEAKTQLIDRILIFGEFEAREPVLPSLRGKHLWSYLEFCFITKTFPRPPDASKDMPVDASDRVRDAIHMALPALRIMERYASRAAARRDAALLRLLQSGP